ncbi:hypothetical protein J7F01_08565 [Streptomyces sp. ISL-22]|uniref:hypothetical protein n=1 Tax=unclassified Streptomyces TaxID=2593676 RepID=UPI001BE9369A|nr:MULTISPECIES: hypothetical protein [unclassified Streptomyces]MBT2418071.1 hypothetical protein [Streptomyces sp. ISL-24]MBT2432254.1 hypothetical protein [Streptomyces sp. ISL-22]
MTTTPHAPGPGTRLLAEQLGLGDPLTALAVRHPPRDRLHRLARALCQTATELDIGYRRAQQAGHQLRALRSRLTPGPNDTDALNKEISSAAEELELMLERCEVLDTALIRLLGIYQYIVPAPRTNPRAAPAAS